MKKGVLSFMSVLIVQSVLGVAFAIDTPTSLDGAQIVTAVEVKDLMAKGVTLYDTRIPSEYAEEHIKGAVSLPYSEKSKKEVAYDAASDKFDDSKLPAEKMVFHCNGVDCWKSYKAAKWAIGKGKKNVYWFRGGFPEWKGAKLPVEK